MNTDLQPNFQQRRDKLLRRIKRAGAPAMLITNQTNVKYLTGFTGSSGWLILTPTNSLLLSDGRYQTQIQEQCSDLEAVIRGSQGTQIDSMIETFESLKLSAVAVESHHITKSWYDSVRSQSDLELVDSEGWVETLRAIKDKSEIAKIRDSIDVNQRAFEVIRAQLRAEQTEREIAHNLESEIRTFGGSHCAFDPIVGVGERSALPHGVPSGKKIGESEFVLIDWGARVDDYCSDLTRVLATAKIPRKIRKIYDIVLRAQLAAIAKIAPGVECKAVDSAARTVIEQSGFGKEFGHGLGHGFGLNIHESPFVNPIREGILERNMVVTVEPGIYLPGVGGVRIEDDVLVTKEGCQVLSTLPKTLDENIIDWF